MKVIFYSETRKAKSEKIGNIFNLHEGLHYCHLNAASIQAKDWKFKQGCALAAPGDLWRLTFALRRLKKSSLFHTNHVLGTLDFTVSEHQAPFNFP